MFDHLSKFTVFAQKKPHPKLGNVQKSMGNVLSFVDGENFMQAAKSHDDELTSLGLNTKFAAPYYAALKNLRKELLKNTGPTENDKKQLTNKTNKLIEAGDGFLGSQRGLENFKTDQTKKDDPFMAEFYVFYDQYVKDIMRMANEPGYFETYFSTKGDFYGSFIIVLDKINQRAVESETLS